MDYMIVKWVHIVSSTILFGTGLGTAFHGFINSLRGDRNTNATAWKTVELADWLFTAPTVILQPASGLLLVYLAGFDPWESWLVATYLLYALAGVCWLPVVWIQIRLARLAQAAAAEDTPLPERFFALRRLWFLLGWPAFLALIAVFYLMVAKPVLW